MDDQEVPALIPAAHDPNVYVVRVKHQITGQGFLPGDAGAVSVLGVGATAVADDVSTRGVIKYPVHISAAVQPVGAIGAGGGAARCCDLPKCTPAVIPTQHQGFPAPEVVDLAHQSAGGLYHGPALRVQVSGQIRQQLLCRGVGDREISSQGGQHSHLSSCSIQ